MAKKNGNNDAFGNCYYNGTINSEIGDFGRLTNNSEHYTVRDFAKTSEEIVSEDVLMSLNLYARANKPNDTQLLYWKAENGIPVLTEEEPVFPYTITNNQPNYITVAANAMADTSVEIKTDKIPAYLKLTKITVNDNEIKANSDGKYIFTMPKNDVTVDADFEFMLEKDSYDNYIVSTDEELLILSKAVNDGYEAGNVVLTADVTASTENGFEPIGTNDNPYKGNFNGKGHTVTLDITSGTKYNSTVATGLFGITSDAYIGNLVIKGSVDGGDDTSSYTGALVGIMKSKRDLYNVYSEVSVSGSGFVGGFIGYAQGGVTFRNAVNNGTVVQKNTADDKKSVGTFVGIGNYNYDTAYYNSEKNSGVFCAGYDNDENKVTTNIGSDIAKTTEELFSDSTMDALNVNAQRREYMYWDFVTENEIQTAKIVEKCPVPVYEIYHIYDEDIIQTSADYSRAGKTIEVEVDLYNDYSNLINSVKEIKVTDSKGKSVKVTKTSDNTYEFTMPKCDVTVSAVLDTGISETTVIDGKTYVVVKNASDFVKAVKSIADGNSELNVYIAENINLTAEGLAEYPIYTDEMKQSYNGIFDGAGHTITFDGLKQSMLYYIGSEGIIKNITVDGTISSIKSDSSDESSVTESMASGIAMANNGQIVNCINKADISGIKASGITILNNGIVYNCMNKGDITGLKLAGAITCSNSSMVIIASNEGKIINQNENSSWNNMTGNDDDNGLLVQDFSSETDSSNKIEFAATANAIAEQIQLSDNLEFKISEDALKWSVSKTELVFADDENIPYYMFLNNGVEEPYKQGETVEFTVDTSSFEEDLVISDITLEGQAGNLKIKVSPVEGKKDTFTFTMPNVMCRLVVKTEVKGIEKDEDGYCLVGTLDDLNKVKQTIDLGNNDINIKLTNNIVGYDGNPIGEYNGTFDGNGHSITLAMNDESNDYQHYGLFEKLDTDAVVKNLTINGSIKANANYVGAVAGLCDGAIINCVNNATVTNALKDGVTGGFIGQNLLQKSPILISNCVNNGEVNGYNVGGIIGYSAGYTYNFSKITDCVNNGKVNAENNGAGIIVVGSHCMVTNCVNNANINANKNAGGIIGVVQYGTKAEIINCANNGSVVSKETAAGIATTYGAITVKNCLNSGNISGSLASYAIAYCNNYYDDSINDFMILNSFYVQTNDVNTETESSNIVIKNDLSKAVSESDISSGYVAAMLNNGVTDGLNYWNVKNSNVVFADDESDLYYAIEIAPNITGGTVTADKQFAKAGETVTLTVTPETEGKSAIITGVELDENNSFVMPDRGVKINAVFGDTFTGTEKNDVIELEKNVEMDEIKLADYVKFENDTISRDFTFTLADGNVLPDGLKLSYARISGTPKKAGTYTVVFDVTDDR